jgi:transketolase
MGAITNGIALDGTFLPFAGTFLVFSDYMRPSLRLAALMKLRSTFVFTHDSIFVGEDGPTHQPVEHLDALRAIPGLTVFRPADGVEAAMAWAYTAARAEGPVVLALSRQGVPGLKREAPFDPEDVCRGGYRVRDGAGPPAVVVLASGSEVALACDAATLLAQEGIAARVVSVRSRELLAEQPATYREELLRSGTPVVAVEAGLGESFRRFMNREDLVYGVSGFGASAPWQRLAEEFGFTPEKLAAAIRAHLGR